MQSVVSTTQVVSVAYMPREQTAPYRRIAAELRSRIESGELRPGEQVPSVSELCEAYGVTRNTALRALRLLRDEGLIVVEQGWGSFVADRQL
jgi:DNA-binding GntR family transcriptional regulator